ncbi:MAG: protoporphyrinogen oxidase [Candidatus Zixiibacteriota bacterium]
MSLIDVLIAGGGISGLSALHFIRQRKPELTVCLYESENRLGGTIGTDHIDGYSFDWGPNGFLDREPLTLQLCNDLGLTKQLEPANANVSNRFILREGRLRSVPMSPGKFLTSDILPLSGKLRVMMEPFGSRPPNGDDESVYSFGVRRIGRQAADYLIQPMVSGIYGGDAERLSLQSCFPIMKEMESEYGSLLKAMIVRGRRHKAAGRTTGGPSGPGGWLTSFHGGLDAIIDALRQKYATEIQTGLGVRSIAKRDSQYLVALADGSLVTATTVILAVPSHAGAEIVKSLSAQLSAALASIPYAPIAVVCMGYPVGAVRADLNGFGFLVPKKERRRILGSIWTSSIFADRAPLGKVQFRTMVGGDGDHESAGLSHSELVELVRRDLDAIVGISGTPEITRIYRWRHGIPQFHIGHSGIMKQIETELALIGNLHITGNAYYGIGLNDCIKQSHRVAQVVWP